MVCQVAHRVHGFLRCTGRHNDLFAAQILFTGKLTQHIIHQHPLIRQPAGADIAAGQHTGAGRNDGEAIVLQCFEVILRDGIFQHMGVHGGRNQLGAGRSQRNGGQHIVGLPVGQLGDDIGRGRRNEHKVRCIGKADMRHIVLEVAVEGIHLTAAAGQRFKHQRRDELSGIFGHQDMNIGPQLDQRMRHIGHFIGCNAPGDAEDDGFSGK